VAVQKDIAPLINHRASPEERKRLLIEAAMSSDPTDALVAQYMWRELIARDDQLAPDVHSEDWTYWIPLAGRGWGKTRAGGEFVRELKEHVGRIALIGPTAADCRDTIVEGESGILAISPPWDRPVYEPSKRRLTWRNGALAFTYSAEEPERLRGPQHGGGWCDELCAWKYPETWDMFLFGLRLGRSPKVAITTTPKPTPLIKALIKDPLAKVVRGSTYDNLENLATTFRKTVVAKFEGTRLGRQELNAEILEDNERALWNRKMIEPYRLQKKEIPDFKKVVVAVDPAVSSNERSAETGIIAAALGVDNRFYVLDDMSAQVSPDKWARRVKVAYDLWHGDKVIGEINNGGDLVEMVIRSVMPSVKYDKVRASRGKIPRAEPIAALYEQGRVSHVGTLAILEDQLCDYDPINSDTSPDRLDALVWALTELSGDMNKTSQIISLGRRLNR